MNDNNQMTDEELDHLCKHVLPALRKDGLYIPGEEKVLTGEMTIEELKEEFIRGFKEKYPSQSVLVDELVGEMA